MKDDELIRRVIAEVLAEAGGARKPRPAPAAAGGAPMRETPRGAIMPVLPAGVEPSADYCALCVEQEQKRAGRTRAILTTTGKNCKGIVAAITAVIAQAGGDIQDISQTIVSGYFTMILVVDIGDMNVTFEELKQRVEAASLQMNVHTTTMHETVLTALHRV
jgi:ACT domain-containing protein